MILLAVISLLLGIFCGGWVFSPELSAFLNGLAGWALNLLMLSVGVSVGANRTLIRYMKENSRSLLIVPLGVIVGSLGGGVLAGLTCGMELNTALAIASGMGWYSLTGVMLTDLAGATMGTIAFLGNVFREILAYLVIPVLAKRWNGYVAIAMAGATSEDTTLPMIMRYTNEGMAVISVLNGMLTSLAVPFLVEVCFRLGR